MLRPSRILRIAQSAIPTPSWSDTLTLPQTTFPPRSGPAEQATYLRHAADELYAWQKETRPDKDEDGNSSLFVLHDGPPYANGAVHVGHAVNKILKDMILRINLSTGSKVSYRPGWDCHGLPIELKALRSGGFVETQGSKAQNDLAGAEHKITGKLPKLDAPRIRELARNLANETVADQRAAFKSWGVMGDWDEPYLTMDKEFELRQLGVFREMVSKGLIYRQNKPVYWSPSSQTALAEAELEYEDNHKVTAAYIKFPLTELPAVLANHPEVERDRVAALIWTTTPWTLPANTAIGIREDITYSLIDVKGQGQLIVAKDGLSDLAAHFKGAQQRTIVSDLTGQSLLDGTEYLNVLSGKISKLIHADFVTSLSGTGLVHLAAGHGMEDYLALKERGFVNVFAPVDDEGKFTAEALPGDPDKLKGLYVESKGTKAVLDVLENGGVTAKTQLGSLVLDAYSFSHRNPIDWRTKQPVIVRATHQWFADVASIQEKALAALQPVVFQPESMQRRLASFIKGRSQWCISRQRAWGVPIPALYRRDTGEAAMTPDSIDHIIRVIEHRGTDAWWTDPQDDPEWISPTLPEAEYVRGQDTMDVWFDSGSSWALLPKREGEPRADLYVEGTDQHRGWFQSSVLTHVAAQPEGEEPEAPFDLLITHGFTLDSAGRKMSKSLGNVVTPEEILLGTLQTAASSKKGKKNDTTVTSKTNAAHAAGCDALRLWVASSDYTRDITISQQSVTAVHQNLAKLRVTFKWLLGVLSEYPEAGPNTALIGDMTFSDHVLLHRLRMASEKVWAAQTTYDFSKAVQEINHFVNVDLSANYFEIAKDGVYAGGMEARLHVQTLLYLVLDELMAMLAPICPVLVSEVWAHVPDHQKVGVEHPLRRVWMPFMPEFTEDVSFDPVEFEWSVALMDGVSSAVKAAQEDARRKGLLGSGLACNVDVLVPANASARVKMFLSEMEANEELHEYLVVSAAEVFPLENDRRRALEENQEAEEALRDQARAAREWRESVPWKTEREFDVDDDAVERAEEVAEGDARGDGTARGRSGRRRLLSRFRSAAATVQRKPGVVKAKVVVMPARDGKCARCWKYQVVDDVVDERNPQEEREEKELCERCEEVMGTVGMGDPSLSPGAMGGDEGDRSEGEDGEQEDEEDGEDDVDFSQDELDDLNVENPRGRELREQKRAAWRNMFRFGKK